MPPAWKIYYLDGSTYAGSPWEAPAFYAMIVVQISPEHGRQIVAYTDYICYLEDSDTWIGMDYPGLLQYLHLPGRKRVLIGFMVTKAEFEAIYRLAENDPDFPNRTGYDAREIRLVE